MVKRERRSIRAPGYDYASPGAYFVTVCTHNRACIFGDISGDEMHLDELGRIVVEEWQRSVEIRREIELDAFRAHAKPRPRSHLDRRRQRDTGSR